MNVLRACAAGGGHHLAYSSASFGGNYYCPRHLADLMREFDPRPGDRVRAIDPLGVGPMAAYERLSRPGGGHYETDYAVVAREGDLVTLRFVAFPAEPQIQVSVAQLYPHGGVRWRRGCGSAA